MLSLSKAKTISSSYPFVFAGTHTNRQKEAVNNVEDGKQWYCLLNSDAKSGMCDLLRCKWGNAQNKAPVMDTELPMLQVLAHASS